MASPEEQLGQILALLTQNSKGIADPQQSMEQVKSAKVDFELWKLEVNTRVVDLKHVVNYIGDHMEQLFGDPSKHTVSDGGSPVKHPDSDPKTDLGKKVTGSAHLEPSSSEASPRKFCNCRETQHRSAGYGMVYTVPDPPPVRCENLTL